MLLNILSDPVAATPLLPLPPLARFCPGRPAPLYCIPQSNQPFKELELSVALPGSAINAPNIPVGLIKLIVNPATAVLLKAKVAY